MPAGAGGRPAAATTPKPTRHWLRWLIISLVVLAGIGAAVFALLLARTTVPSPNEVSTSEATIVYWSDGTTELGRLGEATRRSVALADVPIEVQQAVLAAEDRTFYEHGGISPIGIGRAVWNNVTGIVDAGRVDDHPAVREERLPHAGAILGPQGEGGAPGDQARDRRVEGRDPRGLPQHHLLRSRRVRRRGCGDRLLRGARQRADPRAGRGARRHHQVAQRAGSGGQPSGARGTLGVRPRRDGRAGLADPQAAEQRGVPQDQEAEGQGPARRSDRLHADHGRAAARRARVRRDRDPARRAAHHLDVRPEGAARRHRRSPQGRSDDGHRGPADRARRGAPGHR